MNPSVRPYENLPAPDQDQVDRVCDRFEAACRVGERPDLADCLQEVPATLRGAALIELLLLDIEYRRRRGEEIILQPYFDRFPDDIVLLRRCFAEFPSGQTETLNGQHDATSISPTVQADVGGFAGELFLSRFKLLERVGQGSFGTVHRAFDTVLQRQVALKIPQPSAVRDRDEDRFLREARGAAKLRHPAIVPVFDAGSDGQTLFICSAFVAGRTLREELKEGGVLSPRQSAALVRTLAEALDYAHREGVIHRDVKPENIMLSGDGQPYILDFGLARVDDGGDLRTQEGTILGTPAYMSPEQAAGESHAADGRADLWSLGVLLYELLTGVLPFAGSERDGLVTLQSIRFDSPARPRAHNRHIPRELETVCLKCLEKSRDARYATCADLAEDLRRWSADEPILAKPATVANQLVKWCRRNQRAVRLTAAAFLALLIPLAWTASRWLPMRWMDHHADSFEVLDENFWRVALPGADVTDQQPQVAVENGELVLRNRGYLVSREEFPSGVSIQFRWRWTVGREPKYSDHLAVVVRSAAVPASARESYEPGDGVVIKIRPEPVPSVLIHHSGQYDTRDEELPPLPRGVWHVVKVVDDRETIAVYVNDLATPIATYRIPDIRPRTAVNHFAIYNREPTGGRKESHIDDVLIRVPKP